MSHNDIDIEVLRAELEEPLRGLTKAFYSRPNCGGAQRWMALLHLALRSHMRGDIDLNAHEPDKILDALEAAVQHANDQRASVINLLADAEVAQTMPIEDGPVVFDERMPGTRFPDDPKSPGLT